MEYMFEAGFLGTRAPFFMDSFAVMVGVLPFLIGLTIWFSIKKHYKLHRFFQTVWFLVTFIVLVYFEYGIQTAGGFDHYMEKSSIDPNMAFYFLILHIIVATITMVLWFATIKFATADRRRRALPGLYSRNHKTSGKRVAFLILLTSVTGIGVYWMLFVA